MNPNEIRFSQDSVSYLKRGRVDPVSGQPLESYTYNDIVSNMRANGWVGEPIDVVRMPDGSLTTLDNTRLLAAREAGIDAQVNLRSFSDELPSSNAFRGRFTLKGSSELPATWGQAVENRVLNQQLFKLQVPPVGSYGNPVINYPKIIVR